MIGREITVDDILDNPEKFGLPTFKEFARNPDKYQDKDDHLLGVVDKGGEVANKFIEKQVYKFKSWKATRLEELEKIIVGEGYQIMDLKFAVELEKSHGGKCVGHVEFYTPEEWEQKQADLRAKRKTHWEKQYTKV